MRSVLIIFWSLFTMFQVMAQQNTIAEKIAAYQYPVKYVNLNDSIRVAYVDEGAGEKTLLFIHGLATYLPSWYPQIEALKLENRCIAIDLPGYGRSSKGDYSSTMDFYADVLHQFIAKLNLKNVVLVGHSMGAQVAVSTVLKYSELFKDLILLAPAGFETFRPEHADLLRNATTVDLICGATTEQIRNNWKLNFYEMPPSVEFMIQDRIKMIDASDFRLYGQSVVRGVYGMLGAPVFDRLQEIKTRTLVVYGENDSLIPNKYLNPHLTTRVVAKAGTAQIPNALLKMVPETGHFLSFDKPGEINDLIREFLKN